LRVGDINCRMSEVSGPKADAKTCASMAKKWDITVEKFYDLNPRLKGDCNNVLPNTRYCVDGCEFIFDWLLDLCANPVPVPEPLRAHDGQCGPNHNNATCVGTDAQCCNKKTWTCGDTE
jgi:hypothetical protein